MSDETWKVGDPVWVPGRRTEDYPDAGTVLEVEGPEALVAIPATIGRVRLDRLERRETEQSEQATSWATKQCAVAIEPCARCGRPATRVMWEWEGASGRSPLWVAWVCELFNCGDEMEGLWKGPPWRPIDPRSGVYNPRRERGQAGEGG